ncbi:MAG: helix-turn-helix domain containing protein [Ruminococcus sp.]|nr:helix-turn-helix domain containing protein [Ruminococcus sp.]
MNDKHLNQSDLCKFLGIKDSTFSTWKVRKTDPPAKYLLLICEYLNISIDYLLGREQQPQTSTTTTNNNNNNNHSQFDETTLQVAEEFRKLDFKDKIQVMSLIAELSEKKGA